MKISKNDMKVSKFMSLVLRHKPELIGDYIDREGYVMVSELITGINNKLGIIVDNSDIERIVNEDDKGRYSFNNDKTMIRANQGHSTGKVNLTLSTKTPPDILYHGTCVRVKDSILSKGILHMNRQYVHLSEDIETATNVGKRHGELLIFKIDTVSMRNDGCTFYLSDNNVWLTDIVPVKYITEVNNND